MEKQLIFTRFSKSYGFKAYEDLLHLDDPLSFLKNPEEEIDFHFCGKFPAVVHFRKACIYHDSPTYRRGTLTKHQFSRISKDMEAALSTDCEFVLVSGDTGDVLGTDQYIYGEYWNSLPTSIYEFPSDNVYGLIVRRNKGKNEYYAFALRTQHAAENLLAKYFGTFFRKSKLEDYSELGTKIYAKLVSAVFANNFLSDSLLIEKAEKSKGYRDMGNFKIDSFYSRLGKGAKA